VNLTTFFAASLVQAAERPGLDVEAADGSIRTLTFREIDARADRMAGALRARGVAPGDRLAVCLPNSLGFLDLFLAALRLGAIFTPINVLYRQRELAHILGDAEPRLVVVDDSTTDAMPPTAPAAHIQELLADAEAGAEAADAASPDVRGGDAAAIIYTSGTTGRAKGAVLSHDNFIANARAIVHAWRISAADRYLAVLPLFHVHGLGNGVCAWLATGCRMRLAPRFERARAVELFDAFQPTLFFGVPTIYVRLLEIDPAAGRRIGPRVRLFVSGSAPLPAAVLGAFRERFGHTILERYGMSETLMLTSNPYEGERRPGTVGRPLPGVSVRIVDREGGDVPDDTPGEVLVHGPNVFSGYWRNPQATAGAFTEGWFRTGDIGSRSADGYYTLTGRASDLIITGGFNVYPREIEDVLIEVRGVREAAVAGAPDPARGEVPVAYVVTTDEFSPDQAREACAAALASFKVPRAFIRVDALPRNALGKVQRHRLGSLVPAPTVESE
jgi:malonyl-CoA/methylmalonyl-CoA synthetase